MHVLKRQLFASLAPLLVTVAVLSAAPEIRELHEKAKKGDARAQYELGLAYAEGKGVSEDWTEAAKWYRKAAERGHVEAQARLGEAYSSGIGVRIDYRQAIKWLRKAAETGNKLAENSLGDMYAYGRGVPYDESEAESWYRRACSHDEETREFFPNLLFLVGFNYSYGRGIPEDYARAFVWFAKAAQFDNASAQYELARAYYLGRGVRKDRAEATRWLLKAAYQGNAGAQGLVGFNYALGEGAPKDEIEGLAWINIASAEEPDQYLEARRQLESQLPHEARLLAQQRSRELLNEIANHKQAFKATGGALGQESDISPTGLGSGTIVSREGHVLTAAHIVAPATKVAVVTQDGELPAAILTIDNSNDLAVLKIDGSGFRAIPIGPSRRTRLGQAVSTIGFPNVSIQGFSPKVTRGEISSLNGAADDPRMWQISVPVQPGNSGGPLLDENGNLIGVVVAKLGIGAAKVTGDIPQNVNFAVKSAYAVPLLEPYLDDTAPEPVQSAIQPAFEDMVVNAQQSVVLVLAY